MRHPAGPANDDRTIDSTRAGGPTRVVIADFDGVLNNIRGIGNRPRLDPPWDAPADSPERIAYHASFLDPENVRRLDELVRRAGAALVVSATIARYMTTRELRAMLRAQGYTGTVLARTPVPYVGRGRGRRRYEQRLPRSHEIAMWLSRAARPISGMVILDDDQRDIGRFLPWLVHIDPMVGLQPEDVEHALQIVLQPMGQMIADIAQSILDLLT